MRKMNPSGGGGVGIWCEGAFQLLFNTVFNLCDQVVFVEGYVHCWFKAAAHE